jgi:predicted DNA-binding protein (MmcQ/YjbR family)
MTIEENIFKKYLPDLKKLKEYGFKEEDKGFNLDILFKQDLFKASINISRENIVTGKVYDIENGDEYLPLRIKDNQGTFVGEVRSEYEKLLIDIRENCFAKKYYFSPQSNRITNLIIKKYGNEPEFLWEKFQGSGIFRNPETKKWYLAILDTDRSKIQKGKTGFIEVALIKLKEENVKIKLSQKNIYPGWHMNKKYWITVILDESLTDDEIMKLIEESHSFTVKKTKSKIKT